MTTYGGMQCLSEVCGDGSGKLDSSLQWPVWQCCVSQSGAGVRCVRLSKVINLLMLFYAGLQVMDVISWKLFVHVYRLLII